MGSQAMNQASMRKAMSTKIPSRKPESLVRPPLPMFTRVGPIVPDPGMPPSMADTIFAEPWPISSRLAL